MITASDSFNTVDLGDYFAVLPTNGHDGVDGYIARHGGQPVESGYAYNSGSQRSLPNG